MGVRAWWACGRRSERTAFGVVVALLAMCAPAGAQVQGDQSADRWVTIAARECDEYTDIRANLARNNIMESLRDLGADTLYEAGEPIDPRKELAGQPRCRPLVGWRFTFGRGFQSKAVTGPWGSLSIVTDPDGGQPVVTKDAVPARDFDGHPVAGGQKIAGAVTIGLDREQVDASGSNGLWLQGGTPQDPVLFSDPQFAGRYGFGALRCAIDDLNGDNVETIQFPSGARHMYCHAYYVTPPPSAGTIVIRKQVVGSESPETFGFTGNISYDPGGAFELSAAEDSPASTEFVRAETRPGDQPWTVTENAHDGWSLSDVSCTAGTSTVSTDTQARTAQISLAAGDTVTCTFTNRLTPPAGALVLRKITRGGSGSFPFRIEDADGDPVAQRELVTQAAGGAGAATVIKLDPGRYRVSERRPSSRAGVWRLTGVRCNGSTRPARQPVLVTINAGSGAVCTFTNRLDRPGAIRVRGVSIGGLGTAAYLTSPRFDPRVQIRQLASTSRQAVPELASGQPTEQLQFGGYVIQQSAVASEQRDEWKLLAVTCNGQLQPFAQGRVTVRITPSVPVQTCTFINLRQPAPAPPVPEPTPTPTPAPIPTPTPQPTPQPEPPGPAPEPGGASPELVLDKRLAAAGDVRSTSPTFLVRVTNRSAVTATRVAIADRLSAGTTLISAHPSQGRCFSRGARLLLCTLGDLAAGASATVRVRVQRQDTDAGVNVAVVGSGSPEDVLTDNVAVARISRLQTPPRVCPATASSTMRAAC